ncbi:MAG: ADP-ribosylglycohydrolase family protein [Thermomicrobiales bacterium]
MTRATEDQFLGALLGLAVGDALGRPVIGMTADEIAERYGRITHYVADADADADAEEGAATGVITDETEVTLCIVESLTTNDGLIDPENIHARLGFLVRGDTRNWIPESVLAGIEAAEEYDGLVPVANGDEVDLSVAVRGVPIGLLHAIGAQDDAVMREEAGTISRLSHGSAAQQTLTFAVAKATCAAATGGEDPLLSLRAELDATATGKALAHIIEVALAAPVFEDAVFAIVNEGGAADTTGALAGAIAGARFGASGIPQRLIDELDARIYLSLAAPWFFRTALRRAGTVIDLRIAE